MSQSSLPKLPQDEQLVVSKEGLQYILKHYDPQNPQKNVLWTTDYRVELPVRIKKQGPGSQQPFTLIDLWRKTMSKCPQAVALTWQDKPNNWASITYKQYYDQSIKFAKSLITLGIPEYTAVNIIGFNSVQWAVAFWGSIFGHYLPIGQYTTNGPDACAYIANHSQAQIVFMEDVNHLKKYIAVQNQLKTVKYYVIWKGQVPKDLPEHLRGKVFNWAEFMAFSKNYKPKNATQTLQYRESVQKPGSCATFIYTSGTTGPPKAVMISHDNYTWVTEGIMKFMNLLQQDKIGKQRFLSLLPLSHVAAQLVDLVIALRGGINLFFADATALQGNLVKFLHACRPTLFLSVPRVWQKIQERIEAVASQTVGLKKKIAVWAKEKASQGSYAQINGGPLPSGWSIAKKLVFNKIKQNLGLDQCQIFIFSAAPMKQSTRAFFLNLNIYLRNVFGMSELSGPHTMTDPKTLSSFSSIQALKEAGVVIPGLQLVIANPDSDGQGQICMRGRNVFMGYYKNEKQTKETIDKKGFVHSGDVGMLNSKKVLSITGRIKQLIITAGGQNVAPVLIQNQIHTSLPIFSNVVVIGDKMKFLTCLLTLKVKSPGVLSDEVISYISSKGSQAKTVAQAKSCKIMNKIITQGINKANQKAISNAQKVQRFTILNNQFGVDSGEMTPTMKLKRKIINQKYQAQINSMYLEAKL